MAICTVFLPHTREEDRTPPCHLPTSYITSRASVGECASLPRNASHDPSIPNSPRGPLPSQRASPPYRGYAPRHCFTSTVVWRKRCSRCSAEARCVSLHALSLCRWTVLGWVCTVSQGAQLTAAGWRAARGGTALDQPVSALHAAARHTRHTSKTSRSAGTSTITGGRWRADTRRAASPSQYPRGCEHSDGGRR
jgi:hypothetical protein